MADCTSQIELNKTLECSICLEIFSEPHVLPCQHTFCLGCIRGYAGNACSINCPLCKEPWRIPKDGVNGLKPNIMLKGVIDAVSPSVMQNQDPCHSCEKKGLEMVSHCDDCEGSICTNCKDAHKTMKIYKSHKVQAIVAASAVTSIARHFEKKAVKRKIEEQLRPLMPKMLKLRGEINQMEQLVSQVHRERDEILAKVDSNHQKLIAEIQTYVNEIKAEVNTNADSRLGCIPEVLEKHKRSLQHFNRFQDLSKQQWQHEKLNTGGDSDVDMKSYREVLNQLKQVQVESVDDNPNPVNLLMPGKTFINGDVEGLGGYYSYAKHGVGFFYKNRDERVVYPDPNATEAPKHVQDYTVNLVHEAMDKYGKYPRNMEMLGDVATFIADKIRNKYSQKWVVMAEVFECNYDIRATNSICISCDQMYFELFEIEA